MKLIDLQSGQPINITDKIVTYDGEIGVLTGVSPPAHPGRCGTVEVIMTGASYRRTMMPTVISAKFCDEEDVASLPSGASSLPHGKLD